MALKNTTFRLPSEDIDALKELVELTGLKSGDLKRKVVAVGIETIRREIEDQQGEHESAVPAAFASLLNQQKKLNELVETRLAQAEKMVEKQKHQAESLIDRMSSQQRKLSERIEKQVTQAEEALERQRAQIEKNISHLAGQPRRLGEQVREQLSRIPILGAQRKTTGDDDADETLENGAASA